MSSKPLQPLSKLDRLWLAEAVRLTEAHAGLLEDAEANRRARAAGGDVRGRIVVRAESLAERDGLRDALVHWRQAASVLLIGMVVLALFTGAGLAFAALGEGSRPVNVFWALGSLLGLHLLSLVGWLASLGGSGGGALARLWLWLSGKLAHDARAVQLAPALLSLLARHRLARWGCGLLIHGFWLLVLAAALLMLLALLSARRYGFSWETTLLSADTFVALTRAIGALPSLLGFPLPDPEIVRASDVALDQEFAKRAWAGWLLGALVVYGLLPRLLLAAVCLWKWKRGIAALSIDLDLPEYRVLRERLLPGSESLGVSDPAPTEATGPDLPTAVAEGVGALLVAVELDERRPWPPALPQGVADGGVVNSRLERQRLLERLVRQPPARLAIACDPQRSIDRGTLKLIGELARSSAASRVWLLAPPPGVEPDPARREEWHAAVRGLRLQAVDSAPLTWLESGHD